MEFGKLEHIENINWTLPADDENSIRFLQSLPPGFFQVHFGAPAWSHKEWVGRIYPDKTKPSDYLFHYSRTFNCIELNTTHYQIPKIEKIDSWLQSVPPDFLFCPKLFHGISHSQNGLLDKNLLLEWYHFLERIKPNLGACFIQFPPHFDYSSRTILFRFLQQWPRDFRLCLEFRHPSWFQKGHVIPALVQYLQKQGIGLVVTDVAGRRDVCHTSISAEFMMLRFIGNNLHPSDYTRTESWIKRIAVWKNHGLRNLFYFVHQPNDLSVPEMTLHLTQRFSQEFNLKFHFHLLEPAPIQGQLL